MVVNDPHDVDFYERPPQFWTGVVMKMVVGVFFLGLIGIVIGLFWLKSVADTDGDTKDRSRAVGDTFKDVFDNGSVDQLRAYSNRNAVRYVRAPLARKVDLLDERIQIADRILEMSEEEPDREFAFKSKINALLHMNDLNIQHEFPREATENKIRDVVAEGMKTGIPEVESFSHLAKILLIVLKYGKGEVSTEAVVELLDTSGNKISTRQGDGKRLLNLVVYLCQQEGNPGTETILSRISEILLNSESSEVQQMGIEAKGLTVQKVCEVSSLLVVEMHNEEQGEQVRQFIEMLGQHSRLPVAVYLRAIYLIENIYRSGMLDLASELFENLQKAVLQIPEETVKSKVQIVLDSYKARVALVGQKLVIDAVDALGRPQSDASFSGKPTAILFLDNSTSNSVKYLEAMNNLSYLKPRGVQLVVIAVHQQKREDLMAAATSFNSLIWFTGKDANAVLERFPLTIMPYLIVLDAEGKIVSINVGLNYLRAELEKLL